MPLLSPSKCKVKDKPINIKWLSFPNKVNLLFLNNTFHALIMDSHPIKLNLQISMVKLRNGLKLTLELELPLIIQIKAKLSSLMERNTLTKLL